MADRPNAAAERDAVATAAQGLDKIARRRSLRFGAAVMAGHLDEAAYRALLLRDCSMVTPENDFKWKWMEPQRGKYETAKARRIYNFADSNRMAIHGHTFAWNNDDRIPQWMLDMERGLGALGGRGLADAMRAYAAFLGKSFPHVNAWDCVNEALEVSTGDLANSIFTRALGERFMDVAFGLMREHFPWAKAVYNGNMNWEANPRHRNGVLRLLEAALKRGVRIDMLGIQSHVGNTLGRAHDERDWRRFLDEVQGLGLEVAITELDCADRYLTAKDPAVRDREVAAFVKGYLDLTLSFTNVRWVTVWSLTDRHSNLNRPSYPAQRRRPDGLPLRGCPYDDKLAPKPMYYAIAEALVAAPER